jgi:hypothetical protein
LCSALRQQPSRGGLAYGRRSGKHQRSPGTFADVAARLHTASVGTCGPHRRRPVTNRTQPEGVRARPGCAVTLGGVQPKAGAQDRRQTRADDLGGAVAIWCSTGRPRRGAIWESG